MLYRDIRFNLGSATDIMGAIGTVTGATFNKDKKGWALQTGISKYVTYDRQLLPNSQYTIVTWAKIKDSVVIGTHQSNIVGFNNLGTRGICLSHYDFSGKPCFYIGTNNYRGFNWTPDKKYHCFIFTITGHNINDIDNANLYVDNVLINTNPVTKTQTPKSQSEFIYSGGSNTLFGGSNISRIKVYDHVLTAKEREKEQIEFEAAQPLTYQKRQLQLPKPTELKQTGLIAAYNMKPVGNILHDIVNIPINPNFVIPLISTGTGEGVSTLQLTVNASTTLNINGTGKFYDDVAGTTNEGTTRTITEGGTRTIYLKVPSGSCDITIIKGNTQVIQFNSWSSSTNAASIYKMNLSALPSVINLFRCSGNNTITGNLSSLNSVITYFHCSGNNTITGNLSSLNSVITYFNCGGNNTITDYTSGKDWANLMNYFYLVPSAGGGLSATEIDNLIIDLDNGNTWGGGSRTLYLKGTNAAPTAASLAARTSLTGKGVTITTN